MRKPAGPGKGEHPSLPGPAGSFQSGAVQFALRGLANLRLARPLYREMQYIRADLAQARVPFGEMETEIVQFLWLQPLDLFELARQFLAVLMTEMHELLQRRVGRARLGGEIACRDLETACPLFEPDRQ